MHKHFQFQGFVLTKRLDFRCGQLARQYRTGKSARTQQRKPRSCADGHLCGRVLFHIGTHLPHQTQRTQILQNQRICGFPTGALHGLLQGGKLTVRRQGIQSYMKPHTVQSANFGGARKRLAVKIVGVPAGIKIPRAEIHRVRTAAHGGCQSFRTAAGG